MGQVVRAIMPDCRCIVDVIKATDVLEKIEVKYQHKNQDQKIALMMEYFLIAAKNDCHFNPKKTTYTVYWIDDADKSTFSMVNSTDVMESYYEFADVAENHGLSSFLEIGFWQ